MSLRAWQPLYLMMAACFMWQVLQGSLAPIFASSGTTCYAAWVGQHHHVREVARSAVPICCFRKHFATLPWYAAGVEITHLVRLYTLLVSQSTAAPFINAIYDKEPLDELVHGRLVLLGEAAHPTTPHGLRRSAARPSVEPAYCCVQHL